MLEAVNIAGTEQDKTRPALENQILDLFEDFGRENMVIRYVSMNDPARPLREQWMARTFRNYEEFEFADHDTRFFSSINSDFNVLVVGGNDPARIGSLIRNNRPALANKIKICLMSRSNSHKRARVLGHGFDDVIDITRIAPAEALARILAIRRRQQINADKADQQLQLELRLGQVCQLEGLPARQRQAIEMLFRQKGRVVCYDAMIDEISSFRGGISPANLKVIICKLRKSLIGGARIVSRSRTGYCLEVPDSPTPA